MNVPESAPVGNNKFIKTAIIFGLQFLFRKIVRPGKIVGAQNQVRYVAVFGGPVIGFAKLIERQEFVLGRVWRSGDRGCRDGCHFCFAAFFPIGIQRVLQNSRHQGGFGNPFHQLLAGNVNPNPAFKIAFGPAPAGQGLFIGSGGKLSGKVEKRFHLPDPNADLFIGPQKS